MSNEQTWIGLFTLAPTASNPEYGKYRGACVNILALAESKEDFLEKVEKTCTQMHFIVQEVEDLEPFSVRASNYYLDQQIQSLAQEVTQSGNIQFGTWHTFKHDDA